MSDLNSRNRKTRKEAVRRLVERVRQANAERISGADIAAAIGARDVRRIQDAVRPRGPLEEQGDGPALGIHDLLALPEELRDAVLRELADKAGFILTPKPTPRVGHVDHIVAAQGTAMHAHGKLQVTITIAGADGHITAVELGQVKADARAEMERVLETVQAVEAVAARGST